MCLQEGRVSGKWAGDGSGKGGTGAQVDRRPGLFVALGCPLTRLFSGLPQICDPRTAREGAQGGEEGS